MNSSTVPQTVTYTVTPVGPSPTFCPGTTEIVDVVVNPLPDGTISVDNDVVCIGETILLTFDLTVGTSPFEIVYNNGVSDTTISNIGSTHIIAHNNLIATTTFTLLSVQDLNSCIQNINSQSVTVTVEDPIADFTAKCN